MVTMIKTVKVTATLTEMMKITVWRETQVK